MTATAIAPAGFAHYGTTPTFVGSVAADSQTPVTLSLKAGSNVTSGTYKIPVRITYLDELRNSLTTWVNVSIDVQGSGGFAGAGAVGSNSMGSAATGRYGSSGGSPNLILGAAAVVVVAAAFIFLRRKDKLKQKQSEKK